MSTADVIQCSADSITFRVSDVPLAEELLPEEGAVEIARSMAGSTAEAWGLPDSPLVATHLNALGAIHYAFADHRPLSLAPDHLWLILCQGLAAHIRLNAEALRDRLVGFKGKKTLEVRRDDFIKGSPNNPWKDIFTEFALQIRQHSGAVSDLMMTGFSTTGEIARIASMVTLMDGMQSYFEYAFFTACGIPEITLEGTPADWQRLRAGLEDFRAYDLDWWVNPITPIFDQFVRASQGEIDHDFWCSIYKSRGGSGGPYISGWVIDLFPYLQDASGGATKRNPYLGQDPDDRLMKTANIPDGLSRAPFVWHYLKQKFSMMFVAGFMGVEQNPATKAVRPAIGWAVSDLDALERQTKKRKAVMDRLSRSESPEDQRKYRELMFETPQDKSLRRL